MRRSWTLGLLVAGLLMAAGCAAMEGAYDDDDQIDDCEESTCGCLEEVYLEYAATVTSAADDEPIGGIVLYCLSEPYPVGTSEDDGGVEFTTLTYESPVCGLERCQTLRFHDPYGDFDDAYVDSIATNGTTVQMQPR